MKKIKFISYILSFCLLFSTITFGSGDTNVDNGGGGDYDNVGGGGNGGGNGNNSGIDPRTSITGTVRDEGVRVTLVERGNGKQVTTPIDFANNHRTPIERHFGKVTKLSYIKGRKLNILKDGYDVKKPDIPLPSIINGDLENIKNYFASEVFIKYFCSLTGFNYDNLISGDYKLVVEPLAFPKIKGKIYAMTATELAMYDDIITPKNHIRKNLISFSHQNLPLSMFLEKSDFGITPYKGDKTKPTRNNMLIKAQLGIAVVSFKDKPDEKPNISGFDYVYRTNTDVITSASISGGQSDQNQSADVSFEILGKTYNVGNVFYPSGGNQLAWVKWKTPKKPQEIEIKVTVIKNHLPPKVDVCKPPLVPPKAPDPSVTEQILKVKVVELKENTPPNPVADDRFDSFSYKEAMDNIPKNPEELRKTWQIWEAQWVPKIVKKACGRTCVGGHIDKVTGIANPCRHGAIGEHKYTEYIYVDEGKFEFTADEKYAELNPKITIISDGKNPTAKQGGKEIKSGYGVSQVVTGVLKTNDSSNVTGLQSGISMFPDFYYKDYYRVLDLVEDKKKKAILRFRNNRFSTYNRRTHFTPIWYPDFIDYDVYTYVFDLWTPAGMLSANLMDGVYVNGNLWQDWTVRPLPMD